MMLTLGGRRTIVDLADGSSLLATTRFTCSGQWLHLREATAMVDGHDHGTSPRVSVNLAHVITVQFPK